MFQKLVFVFGFCITSTKTNELCPDQTTVSAEKCVENGNNTICPQKYAICYNGRCCPDISHNHEMPFASFFTTELCSEIDERYHSSYCDPNTKMTVITGAQMINIFRNLNIDKSRKCTKNSDCGENEICLKEEKEKYCVPLIWKLPTSETIYMYVLVLGPSLFLFVAVLLFIIFNKSDVEEKKKVK